MKIRMRNTIQFDEQLEVIDQLYDVEVCEKGDYSYLLFYNEEKEKVVLKFHGQERLSRIPFFRVFFFKNLRDTSSNLIDSQTVGKATVLTTMEGITGSP